jgi:alpha-beta hydrolase superfamily lysophospholipase
MFSFARALSLALAAVMVAALAAAARAAPAGEPVALTAADGVKVFATYYGAADTTKPIVLLFHMAGANSGEYAPIAPRLIALGFNALAVDQRSGGTAFGRANKTVEALGHSTGYRAALADLQAALAWARANHAAKVIVCGSSYSASLVFLLAAGNPGKIAGLMAFSPGEYLGGGNMVRNAAAKLKNIAVFVSSASDRGEIAAARTIIGAVPVKTKTQFVPKHAPHGASALRADDNPTGYKAVWTAIERFLNDFR